MGMGIDDSTFTWEMIGLGLEEPLPPQETIDELYVSNGILRHCVLIFIQTPSVLREDPSISTYDPQVSIFGSYEFVCKSIHPSLIRALPLSNRCFGTVVLFSVLCASFSFLFCSSFCVHSAPEGCSCVELCSNESYSVGFLAKSFYCLEHQINDPRSHYDMLCGL
jgi:hypothetical protein